MYEKLFPTWGEDAEKLFESIEQNSITSYSVNLTRTSFAS